MTSTDQYRTIADGAGWIDLASRGRLRFEGADVGSFLQALLTNDVSRLKSGEGLYSAYLTPQGRMLTDLELYRRPAWWLADVVPGQASGLLARLDGSIFSEDVRVTDDSGRTGEMMLVGGLADTELAVVLSLSRAALSELAELSQIGWEDGFVARTSDALLPTFKIFASTERLAGLVADLDRAGIPRITDELVEALRVEAGRPRFGVDMNEETIPLEAGLLDRAISTTKGCYVGQEIIIRILHRGGGRVAKRLVTVALDAAAAPPPPGAVVMNADREIGRLTSVATSPTSGAPIALGYVHRDFAVVGQRFTIGGPEGTVATVTGLAH